MSLVSARTSGRILLAGLGLLAAFHALVLARVLPGSAVWGGQAADNPGNLILLEATGLAVTLLFALVVALKLRALHSCEPRRPIDVGVWVVFGYFLLNTLGNLASVSSVEKAVFTPVSLVLALLALRLAMAKRPSAPSASLEADR